jgi:hypothetical protein
MCSVAVRHVARPLPLPPDPVAVGGTTEALGGAVAGEVAGLDAAGLAGIGAVVAGAEPAWLEASEPQAAISSDAAAAAVSHVIRRTRPAVLAVIARLTPLARLVVVVIGAPAEGRGDVDITCSFVRRTG